MVLIRTNPRKIERDRVREKREGIFIPVYELYTLKRNEENAERVLEKRETFTHPYRRNLKTEN